MSKEASTEIVNLIAPISGAMSLRNGSSAQIVFNICLKLFLFNMDIKQTNKAHGYDKQRIL